MAEAMTMMYLNAKIQEEEERKKKEEEEKKKEQVR